MNSSLLKNAWATAKGKVFNLGNTFLVGGTMVQYDMGNENVAMAMGASVLASIANNLFPQSEQEKQGARKLLGKRLSGVYNFLRDQNLSTRSLVAFTAAQCAASGYELIQADNPNELLHQGLVTTGFGLGTAADLVLNRVQEINSKKEKAAAKTDNERPPNNAGEIFKALSIQPVTWWSMCNIVFASALLTDPKTPDTPAEITATIISTACYLAATGYNAHQIRRYLKGEIGANQINNGNENLLAGGGYAAQGILAASKEQYYYMAAMFIFTHGMHRLRKATHEAGQKIGLSQTPGGAPTLD